MTSMKKDSNDIVKKETDSSKEKKEQAVAPKVAPTPPMSALEPPSYQRVERCNDEDKVCRICLEDDFSDCMIAPCKCKGSSKWVHRNCLDEWRTNEKDRAFSKCTECLFQYHMQPFHQIDNEVSKQRRRNIRYAVLVSRDICFMTVILQLLITALGGFVYVCDPDQAIAESMNLQENILGAYYLMGWVSLFIMLGVYGSVMICSNDCSAAQALDNATMAAESGGGSERYRNRRRGHQGNDGPCSCCCYHGGGPYYLHSPCPDCSNCCYCCGGSSGGGGGSSGHHGGCNCFGACDANGSGSDCAAIFCFCLAMAAFAMAVVGFFVGMVITVIVFQRVIQKHVYILHKRQLAQEFQVMDLAGYDLAQPNPENYVAPETAQDIESGVAPTDKNKTEAGAKPALPQSSLKEQDAAYLKDLGLL